MPQPVELRVGSGRHRGVPMPEPDDRDPAAEVDSACAARVVPDPAALAAHDRDVGTGAGGEHRVSRKPS